MVRQAVAEFFPVEHGRRDFVPGRSSVPPAGKVYGPQEMQALVDASLDFWLTTGRFNDTFERRLAEYLSVRHVLTANSGSSANLLALTALTSPLLGDRALNPGDEVLTVAAAFPTTVNPILQNRLVPVFVDVDIPTYNVCAERIEEALSERTRAVILAHTLGNPFDLDLVMGLAERHNLWVVEDCCDALGSLYRGKKVGTFGHVATFSFYPAHHITMGEGGAVCTDNPSLFRAVRSLRDWGRDCWCPPGRDNTCRQRFTRDTGRLPKGYDHKYTYSHTGYNFKITDMQAAVGSVQLDRLGDFTRARRRHFALLNRLLADLENLFHLPEPTRFSEPSWFGYPLCLRAGCGIRREELLTFLNERRIGTRLLFGGNLTRQPYFAHLPYRVSGTLRRTDEVMHRAFWLGLYPGLSEEMLAFTAATLHEFCRGART
jgi:CDP-6-deoxy-D-xylo-4-hexulose-3-dehydrase